MGVIEAIGFVAFGLFVGAYGTLVGAGGGFLVVPMLLLVYGATPQFAVGTSLTVVFLNAVSGTISYARQKRIDYQTGVRFAIATLPGAAIGAYLSSYLTSGFFNLVFGLLLIATAVFLFVRPEARSAPTGGQPTDLTLLPKGMTRRTIIDAHGDVLVYTFNERAGLALSFVVGFLSSILGIGGGIIHVPAMVHLFGFPAHIATATSHFILAISAGTGTGFHLALDHVKYPPAILLGMGVVFGAQVGAAISQRVHGRWLIRLLSIALIIVGVRLLLSARLG